jgi:hypothetical protein
VIEVLSQGLPAPSLDVKGKSAHDGESGIRFLAEYKKKRNG